MTPRPEPTEVKQLASKAINLRKNERISMQEAIETVCSQALVPTTDTPLTIENVQAYLRLLRDAVTYEIDGQRPGSEDKTLYIS